MRKTTTQKIPAIGEGKRGDQAYLGYLLRQANTAYRARMEKALADIDITPPQFSVLTMLAAYPGLSNADLARLSLLTPQTVSVIVNNLEKSGALSRRPHAVHGRIQHLDITDEGKALLQSCKQRVNQVERELASHLHPDEAAVVRRWLIAIALDTGPAAD
ncbi:MAG: MarR family transcriptional regulator [Burkholderiales bacterium]|nr:MarR family transcriptional regulator [Burkholderiales bacterium]